MRVPGADCQDKSVNLDQREQAEATDQGPQAGIVSAGDPRLSLQSGEAHHAVPSCPESRPR